MGCKGSKMGCCLRPRRKKRKTKGDHSALNAQELTTLKDGPSSVPVGSEKNHAGSPGKRKLEQEELAKEREAEIARRLSEQAETLKTDHEAQFKELQRSHAEEKASMTEEFQTSQAALQSQLDELSSQVQSFQDKMKLVEESVLNRDYKRHIEEYGSPGEFWEQELQSLHFVIEMKNERLHEMNKKLLNLHIVMERNRSLEEKVTALQQENEDLHVQIQNHISITRQLSEELQAMQEALERETQTRQQLHHEKEELLYRVLNDKSLPAFQLSAGVAEVPLIAT
ncbi:coiled-coil domain-containing protein 69 [Ambystoma mexicanum]|uniref:coiled-coil domain-containing protein 69 n=1 Tax=Ambystoma mexicanum TaxID=8296 RepID=UPI0037E8AD94